MNGTILVHGIPCSNLNRSLDLLRSKLICTVENLEPLKLGLSHIACTVPMEFKEAPGGGVTIAQVYADPHDDTSVAMKILLSAMYATISKVLLLKSHALGYVPDSPDKKPIHFNGTGIVATDI